MRQFLQSGGWNFPVMIASDDVAAAYKVQAVPTLFVVDQEGRVVRSVVGGATAVELSRIIDDLSSCSAPTERSTGYGSPPASGVYCPPRASAVGLCSLEDPVRWRDYNPIQHPCSGSEAGAVQTVGGDPN